MDSPSVRAHTRAHVHAHIFLNTVQENLKGEFAKSEYLDELNMNILAAKAQYFCVTYTHEFFHTCTYCNYIL